MRIHQLLITLIITYLPICGFATNSIADTKTQIHNLVYDYLLERTEIYPGQAIIKIEEPQPVSACENLQIGSSGTIRTRTTVKVRCFAPEPWTLYVKTNIKILGSYFVAARVIQRDQLINQDDVELRDGDLLRVRRAISDPARIIGWISKRRIPRGTIIDTNDLRDPNSIQRGQQVRTIVRGSGFTATGVGEALSTGTPGTQIQVRTSSGKIITGTVINANTVQVLM